MDPLPDKPATPRDYAKLNVAWSGLIAALLAATARDRRDAPPLVELPVLGLATFALSKALSKEKVGVWARAPLVEPTDDGDRQPRGSGVRYVLGELVTCSRCLGAWGSLGLVGLRVARPREGRIVASVLAVAATNDFLQSGFSILCAKANATESPADLTAVELRRVEAGAERETAGAARPR